MNFSAHIENALSGVELCSTEVSAALVSGDPLALLSASSALRQAALDFSQLLQDLTPADLKNRDLKTRLKKLADGMASQRENLLRRSVLVERALNAIMPATLNTTYTQAAGPYGSVGKQSGAFKLLAA